MSTETKTDKLIEELWTRANPGQFELLLGKLLQEMGFSDVKVTGQSGDGGVDLNATWTQSHVPGLEIDLQFVIQAKRTRPSISINPRYVRELRGAMKSGEWGLLITTGKVSESARRNGIEDPSRAISIIDGAKLAQLCREYKVGVRQHFEVDLSTLEQEPAQPAPEELGEEFKTEVQLSQALNEKFERIGNSSIFKSRTKVLLARSSQYYKNKSSNYWYGVTPKDLERAKEYNIKQFAFVCDKRGVILVNIEELKRRISEGVLWKSPTEGPEVRHYHMLFKEVDGRILWQLKGLNLDIIKSYRALK